MITSKTSRTRAGQIAAIVIAFVACGDLDAAETFRWKLTPGDRFDATMTQRTTLTMTVGERTVEIPQSLTLNMKWRITSVDDQGLITMTQTIDRARMTMTAAGENIKFDSNDDKEHEGVAREIAKVLKPMVGAAFTQRMTSRGEVKDMVIPKSVVNALGTNPFLKEFFAGEGFKDMMVKASPVLPEQAIGKGFSWKSDSATKTPAGTMKIHSTYTYQGEGKLDGRPVGEFAATVNLEFDDTENDLGAKIEISKQQNTGTIFFDAVAGHIARVTMDQAFTIKVTVGDDVVDQDLKTSLTMTVKRIGN